MFPPGPLSRGHSPSWPTAGDAGRALCSSLLFCEMGDGSPSGGSRSGQELSWAQPPVAFCQWWLIPHRR